MPLNRGPFAVTMSEGSGRFMRQSQWGLGRYTDRYRQCLISDQTRSGASSSDRQPCPVTVGRACAKDPLDRRAAGLIAGPRCLFLSAVLGVVTKSWLVGVASTGLVTVCVAWFAGASKYSTSDLLVWRRSWPWDCTR
jgi:hypothetical protein